MSAETPLRVVITGAATGIGHAIAQVFLREGARVVIGDVSAVALERALGDDACLDGFLCDVADAHACEKFMADARSRMGGIDVLVNNAGIGGPAGPVDEIPVEGWQQTIAVNLNGMFHCVRAVVPQMKARGSGSIINISTGSVAVALPNRAPYVASKAGVEGLTRELARELGPFGIRCNAIAPGLIDNPRGRALVQHLADERNASFEEIEAHFLKFISLRTWIDPEEIGEAAYFFASHAGRHISGQILGVCGNIEWEE